MPDVVTSQTLHDDARKLILKLTNVSDGSGEAAVTKVDVSTLASDGRVLTGVRIEKIEYSTIGMAVLLYWDASTDVLAWAIPPDASGCACFDPAIVNNAGTGVTGDLQLTTVGHTAGDAYAIILHLSKKID